MPPDAPRSTTLPVVMRRGGFELSTPSSVAQVSAFTAAMAPAKASQGQDWDGNSRMGHRQQRPQSAVRQHLPPIAAAALGEFLTHAGFTRRQKPSKARWRR